MRNLGSSYDEKARALSRVNLLSARDRFARHPGNGAELGILDREIEARKVADAALPAAFREWND